MVGVTVKRELNVDTVRWRSGGKGLVAQVGHSILAFIKCDCIALWRQLFFSSFSERND